MNKLITLLCALVVSCSACNKVNPDPCDGVACMNNGTCNNGNCQCPNGYGGNNCETEWRDGWAGTYAATDQCYNLDHSYTATVENGSDATRIIVNLQYQSVVYPVLCILDGPNHGNFPQQTVSNRVFTGQIYRDAANNILSPQYNISGTGMSDGCNQCTWIKQ